MSLPTQAYFFKENSEEPESTCFVNCGWIYDEASTKTEIVEFLNSTEEFEWDYVRVYGETFQKHTDFKGYPPLVEFDEEIILQRRQDERDRRNPPILQFKDEYRWLSNFHPVKIKFHDREYPSVEHAYMSAKLPDDEWKEFCADASNSAGAVKKASRKIPKNKLRTRFMGEVMEICLREKFKDPELKEKLLETGRKRIVEGNWWNDTYWGVCLETNVGENRLGELLMEIRRDLFKARPIIMPIVNRKMPLLSDSIEGVKPMEKYEGKVFSLRVKDETK